MVEPRPIVDIEQVLVAALGVDTALADVVDDRIGTRYEPDYDGQAAITLHRSGGTPTDPGTERLDRPIIDLAAWAPTKGEAFTAAAVAICAVVRSAGVHDSAVITGAERISGPTWSPDPHTETPRYLITFALHVHPA